MRQPSEHNCADDAPGRHWREPSLRPPPPCGAVASSSCASGFARSASFNDEPYEFGCCSLHIKGPGVHGRVQGYKHHSSPTRGAINFCSNTFCCRAARTRASVPVSRQGPIRNTSCVSSVKRGTHVSAAVAAPAVLGAPPAGLLRLRRGPAGAAQLALLDAAVVSFLPAAPRPIALAVAAVAAPQADAPIGRRALAAVAAATGSPGLSADSAQGRH